MMIPAHRSGGGGRNKKAVEPYESREEDGSAGGDSGASSIDQWLIKPSDVSIESIIGEGSTAVVYSGTWRGKPVAIKELHEMSKDKAMAFQRELSVLIKVQHRNIVQFFGLVSEISTIRLLLEHCNGGSLFDLLHNNPDTLLSWRQRLVMLYDVAVAVSYLHSFTPAIVHRDLKSPNVLLLNPVPDEHELPHIKLADFGFAREAGRNMTQGAGTLNWMAPEVCLGTAYTEMADTFSYAMIAYEVVTRRVPFMEVDRQSVFVLLSSGVRPNLEDNTVVPRQMPPGLLELIARCWDQEPRQRPSFQWIWQFLVEVSANTSDILKLSIPTVVASPAAPEAVPIPRFGQLAL